MKVMRVVTFLGLLVFLGPFSLVSAQQSSDWASWGGPTGDFKIGDADALPDGEYALKVVWKKEIGTGYSAVSVSGGLAVTLFSEGEFDYIIALDAEDGTERWKYKIGPAYFGHYGSQSGPLSTPVLTEHLVIGLSAQGRLFALDIKTGQQRWSTDLVGDHQAIAPFWGFTSSPGLYQDLLYVQMGGTQENAIAAFETASGNLLWSAHSDSVNYQSPGLFRFGNQDQVVFHGNRSLAGVDPKTGAVLWDYDHGGSNGATSTSGHPVEIGEGRYFVKNQSNGGVLLQLHQNDGVYSVEEVWKTRQIRGTYVYAVYHGGYLFGYNRRILMCLDAATGDRVWRSREPGDGFPIVVDGHLVVVTKAGKMAIAKASGESYEERARLDLFENVIWSPPSFANGKIYARSMSEIACVEIVPRTDVADSDKPVPGQVPDSRFAQFVNEVTLATEKSVLIDSFMAEQKTFPVIEGDSLVHFVYRGKANEVGLTGDLIGSRFDQAMHRIEGTGFFYYSSHLESDVRMAYQFIVDLTETISDPKNKRLFRKTSWFAMPKWQAPTYLTARQDGVVGRIDTVHFESESTNGPKRLEVYLPAGYDQSTDRYPVIYMHGSSRPFTQGLVDVALDNLIGNSVRPVIVVIVPSFMRGGYVEYMGDGRAAHAQTFTHEVVPFIDQTYRTVATRMGRVNMGSSRGGFMAFYATFNYPNQFGKLAIQTMGWSPTTQAEGAGLLTSVPKSLPIDIYLDWGKYDSRSPMRGNDSGKGSAAFAALLKSSGYDYVGGMVNAGAGWLSWQCRFDQVFETLFPFEK